MELVIHTSTDGIGYTYSYIQVWHQGKNVADIDSGGKPQVYDNNLFPGKGWHFNEFQPMICEMKEGAAIWALLNRIAQLESTLIDIHDLANDWCGPS